ncbi:MAG: hypothetical protein V1754_11890 [Pseudomonadota bacterium]
MRVNIATGIVFCVLLCSILVLAQPQEKTSAPKNQQLSSDAIDVEVMSDGKDRSILQVRNRTPFVVLLYVHGVRVGWLRPYRTGTIRGLRAGYHRVYAHSRWGSVYWGPKRVWVPGNWNLYR